MPELPSLSFLEVCIVVAAGGALGLSRPALRALGASGLALLALAAASLRIMPGAMPMARMAQRAVELGISPETLLVDASFILGGAGLLGAAAVASWRESRTGYGRVAAALVGLGGAGIVAGAWPLLRVAGAARGALAALALVGSGALLRWLGGRLGLRRGAARVLRWTVSRPVGAGHWPRPLQAGLVISTALVGILPTLWSTLAAMAVAAWCAHAMARHRGDGPEWPWAFLAVAGLGAAVRYMAVIVGVTDPAMTALPDAPFSTPAEYLLAPGVLLAAWGLLGLPPFTRFAPGTLLAPVGLLVVYRVAVAGLPDGVDHWRPVLWSAVAAAMLIAAVARDRRQLVVAVALLALTAMDAGTGLAAALLLGGAMVALAGPTLVPHAPRGAWRAGWLACGGGGMLTLRAALPHEVVLSLVGVVAVLLALSATGGHAAAPEPA